MAVLVVATAAFLAWKVLYELGVLRPARLMGYNLFDVEGGSESVSEPGGGSSGAIVSPGAAGSAVSGAVRVVPGDSRRTEAGDALEGDGNPSDWPGLRSGERRLPHTCLDALRSGASPWDGLYDIDPDGHGGSPGFLVYCDMTTDGGGWTLCLNSLRGSGAPYVETGTNAGYAGWWNGHVRDCRFLYRSHEVEVRHLLVVGEQVVNRSFVGRPGIEMPPAPLWRRFGAGTAREGEEDDGKTFDLTLAHHLQQPWIRRGPLVDRHGIPWFHTPDWGALPSSHALVRCGGGPVVRWGNDVRCADRYAVFVREAPVERAEQVDSGGGAPSE